MAHDGELEATAILALLAPLAGGRWYEGVPDDAALAVNTDSTIKPFGVVSFGDPVPKARGRGIGVTEAGQPYVLPFTVTSVAGSAAAARALAAGVTRVLIGVKPSANNSSEIRGIAGHKFTTLNNQAKPSRFYRVRYLECDINMATS